MQEFLQKLCQGTHKTSILRNLIQKLHVYLIIKVNSKFSPFCTTKTFSREVLEEFAHFHYIQEFLQKLYQGTLKTLILRSLTQNQRVFLDFESKSYIYLIL